MQALILMGKGMLALFISIAIIFLVVKFLDFCAKKIKRKQKKEDSNVSPDDTSV